VKIEIIVPGAILFSEPTQFASAYAFMRLQEFYENPIKERQGKFYTLDESIESYAAGIKGKFSYLEDWAGFNVPGHVVDEFHKTHQHDYTKREQEMMDALTRVLDQEENAMVDDKYYIIGACSDIYVDHELCHAMWYLYPEFKKESMKLMKKLPKAQIKATHKMLLDTGYADNVLDDETNAYLATNTMYDTMEDIMCHLTPAEKKKFSWDKIYPLVANYWDFKHENMLDDDEMEIKLK